MKKNSETVLFSKHFDSKSGCGASFCSTYRPRCRFQDDVSIQFVLGKLMLLSRSCE